MPAARHVEIAAKDARRAADDRARGDIAACRTGNGAASDSADHPALRIIFEAPAKRDDKRENHTDPNELHEDHPQAKVCEKAARHALD
ncbi:MAG: hypothetical protein KGI94_04330 [Paracoccaceae bacterium]|nr:hypothetical protein [Paracoccaceae bacterium]